MSTKTKDPLLAQVERDALETMARGADLQASLDAICRLVEREIAPLNSVASVMLVEDGWLRAVAAPSFPSFVGTRFRFGPGSGSCGNAALTCRPVFVEDTLADDRWADLRQLATSAGIRCCWSIPIVDPAGQTLATFAISGFVPRLPEPLHEEGLRTAGHLVSLVLERERSREQREQLEQRVILAKQLEGLGLLAGGIAHDFNNLLQVILGNVELARDCPPEESEQYLEQASTAARTAAGLCRQILDYAGRQQGDDAPLDLSALADETIRLLNSSLEGRLTVESHLTPDLWVMGHAPQLQSVLQNLLLNATEAVSKTDEGQVRLTIRQREVSAKELEGWDLIGRPGPAVEIEVEDNGDGIPPHAKAAIFEPFYTTKPDGRGLGLSAALGIVHKHQGSLRVESTPGHGTTFCVALPQASQKPQRPEEAPAEPPETARVVVVEDDPGVMAVLQTVLTRAGHTVQPVPNGREALELILGDGGPPDLLVLDLSLPGLSGVEVFEAVRQEHPTLKVLVSSGRGEIPPFTEEPGVAWLPKPYGPDELTRAADKLLGAS